MKKTPRVTSDELRAAQDEAEFDWSRLSSLRRWPPPKDSKSLLDIKREIGCSIRTAREFVTERTKSGEMEGRQFKEPGSERPVIYYWFKKKK